MGALPAVSPPALFLRDSWLRLYQYRSVPLAHYPPPQSIFVSCPDYFRGTGKSAGIQEASHSQFKKTKTKKKSPLEHFLYIVTVNFSFIWLQISLFFTWKGDTKIRLCYRRREKAPFPQSLSSVWEFLFRRLPSRSDPPLVNCAPIPKMVPHSLNEQKCIGELVRGRA